MRTFHVIREVQVETTRYHFTPTRMAKIENLTTLNPDMGGEQVELSFLADGTAECTATLEASVAISHEVKHTLTFRTQPSRFWRFIR